MSIALFLTLLIFLVIPTVEWIKKRGDEAYKNCHIINKFRNNENKKIQLYELILS